MPSITSYPSINIIAPMTAVITSRILSSLNSFTSMNFCGALESLVVAIIDIIDNPNVIMNKLLPSAEPIAVSYEPSFAAATTIPISGSVVAILSRVLPTNLPPHLSARCSAPSDSSQLAKISSPSHPKRKRTLSANLYLCQVIFYYL